jgi:hypothetical protein
MRYSADAGSEAPEHLVMSGGGEVARRNADSSTEWKRAPPGALLFCAGLAFNERRKPNFQGR